MASCMTQIHFWTLKPVVSIPDQQLGVFTYHDKKDSLDSEFVNEKRLHTENRDVTWTPSNKHPEKLRDSIKEMEVLLAQHTVFCCQWLSRTILELLLSNGVVITFVVSAHTGDIDHILIDKSLVGKLSAENSCDGLVTDNFVLFCYPDKQKMDYFYFTKKPEIVRKVEKLSNYEIKHVSVELVGPSGRQLQRHLTSSSHEDLVACWWPMGSTEAWPWSPMTSEADRSNLLIFSANGPRVDLIAYIRTDCDPVLVKYSLLHPHQLYAIEQATGVSKGQTEVCVYECQRGQVEKVQGVLLTVSSDVVCAAYSPAEDWLVLACKDKSVVMVDVYRKVTSHTMSSFEVVDIRWHLSSSAVLLVSSSGELQMMDIAAQHLTLSLVQGHELVRNSLLNIKQYLRSATNFRGASWCPLVDRSKTPQPDCCDHFVMVFDKGPVVLVQFFFGILSHGVLSNLSLVKEYLKLKQVFKAVTLLGVLNWDFDAEGAFACLNEIVNHLLRLTLNPEREMVVQTALSTFYAPLRNLRESTIMQYKFPVSRLARRFFHHLLRYSRFEKAYLLAVDIGARDLFMDIYYVAQDKGELALAHMAKEKAAEIDNEALRLQYGGDEEDEEERSLPDEEYCSSDEGSNGVPLPPPQFADSDVITRLYTAPLPGYVSAAEFLVRQAEQSLTLSPPPEYVASLELSPRQPVILEQSSDSQTTQSKKAPLKITYLGAV